MNNRDRAVEALQKMTARAYHLKKVTQYIIDNNRFTSQSVEDATNVPAVNVARTVNRLMSHYGFIIDIKCVDGHYEYYLRDCVFDGSRMPERFSHSSERVPLKKPIYLDPLWKSALGMKETTDHE